MRFAYTRPDGGVSIVIPVPREQLERTHTFETNEDYERFVIERSIPPDATNVMKLPDDYELPARCEFRNAWKIEAGKVDFDMIKARNMQRDRIRAERAPMLAALDVEYQRADEAGDTAKKAQISARKQELRDAPADPRIDGAKNVDELRAIRPGAGSNPKG